MRVRAGGEVVCVCIMRKNVCVNGASQGIEKETEREGKTHAHTGTHRHPHTYTEKENTHSLSWGMYELYWLLKLRWCD